MQLEHLSLLVVAWGEVGGNLRQARLLLPTNKKKKILVLLPCQEVLPLRHQERRQRGCNTDTDTRAAAPTPTRGLQQRHLHEGCSSDTDTRVAAATPTRHRHEGCGSDNTLTTDDVTMTSNTAQ